ncbi:hypothetical protein MASR2M18_19970 [Ignavibacteria bacterium]|nr:DUF4835 family protein [Bacteroidota bacterium]MCZ2132859.1 DUF4835 family protein [Bacteroidota bacterium]
MKYLLIFILSVAAIQMTAQEIQPTVNVDVQLLPAEARVDVQTMRQDVAAYISSQRFTGKDWDAPRISVDINITLTGKNGNRYSAILSVSSSRIIDGPDRGRSVVYRAVDKDWNFEYAMNANLTYQTLRFNDFSTLLDFYMCLIIGFDMDTYGELDGSAMFDAAKDICRLGASYNGLGYQNTPEPGVPSRIALASELTDMRFEDFRKFIFEYYVDGLDSLAYNKQNALSNIARALEKMRDFKQNKTSNRSILIQTFFGSKYQELADLFRGSDQREVFRTLREVDPGNTGVYEQARDDK